MSNLEITGKSHEVTHVFVSNLIQLFSGSSRTVGEKVGEIKDSVKLLEARIFAFLRRRFNTLQLKM
jgi:hypothetical protein